VPTAELGHPVVFLVLVKSDDGLLHPSGRPRIKLDVATPLRARKVSDA
jgi:hypothetical protein